MNVKYFRLFVLLPMVLLGTGMFTAYADNFNEERYLSIIPCHYGDEIYSTSLGLLYDCTGTIVTMEICSLTHEEPFYNCDEKWKIHQTDVKKLNRIGVFGDLFDKSSSLLGFASMTSKEITLSNNDKIKPYLTYKTVLAGELEHLRCDCNYHGADVWWRLR